MSVDFAHHEMFRAKVGKGGIKLSILGIAHASLTVLLFNRKSTQNLNEPSFFLARTMFEEYGL